MPVMERDFRSVAVQSQLCEWGTSRAVRIPKRMCEIAGIDIGERLDVRSGADDQGAFIVIRPSSNHRSYGMAPCVSMEDAFDGYEGNCKPMEFDWGMDVGLEVVE